ncbi:zf-HC2 domain-containing protein [Candidatus Aerophobetes bacterium]|nr:zf-HC2 domain-containing protein [Candidatus Aerophobetes bacterium]
MKCKRLRRKLVAYLDGELREKQKHLIKKHLSQCAECRKEAHLLNESFCLLKGQDYLKPSEDFLANLWERIYSTEEKQLLPQVIFGRLVHLILPAAVAAVLIIGVLVGSSVEKIIPSQTVKLKEERYLTSIGLDSFQDLPTGSLPEIYLNLASAEEVENG